LSVLAWLASFGSPLAFLDESEFWASVDFSVFALLEELSLCSFLNLECYLAIFSWILSVSILECDWQATKIRDIDKVSKIRIFLFFILPS